MKIRFFRAVDGEKEIVAVLVGADKDKVTIATEEGLKRAFPFRILLLSSFIWNSDMITTNKIYYTGGINRND